MAVSVASPMWRLSHCRSTCLRISCSRCLHAEAERVGVHRSSPRAPDHTTFSSCGRLPPRSNRGGPTRTCAYVLDEVALLPVHDGSAHNADNVSRSPTSGMRTATVGGGCRAPRTDPAMATAGCQRSSTSRGAGSAEASEPHRHPGSCCICSIGTPASPRSRPTSLRVRADADRVRGKGLSTSV